MGLLIGTVWFLSPVAGSAETLYAKREGVKITVDKSPMSRVVETLGLGDRVQVLEKAGRHYRVKAPSGKRGWVFKFKLSDKPVEAGGGSGLSGLIGGTRIAAREARSGGSIRGLKEAPERYSKAKHIDPAHRAAVERMERRTISRRELLEFQREGSVGEFAGG